MSLTRDVTHLFAISPGSQKYETALHFQDITKVKIILPHWFDDAVRLGMGFLPTSEYEWPEPRLFRTAQDGEGDEGKKIKTAADKKVLFKMALWTPGKDVPVAQAGQRDIWQGRRILLSPSLGLTAGRREAVEAGIRRGNGVVIEYNSRGGDGDGEEETTKIQEADILVTRYRSGAAYAKVCLSGCGVHTPAHPWPLGGEGTQDYRHSWLALSRGVNRCSLKATRPITSLSHSQKTHRGLFCARKFFRSQALS
jgi:hypothetical protein